MEPPDQSAIENLLDHLRAAVGLLDAQTALRQDVLNVCDRLTHPTFRIAVFGPFNYGKSTLLNALLGERTLPIDLIPTTGAAIAVRYGTELQTRIRLLDGSEIQETGTKVLKRFAILDDNRRMRDDVAAVEVFCPHPFLKTGVELLDLPGTNDREAQDALVRDQLLMADLVVQVLDGRKLMTLGERENLRDWLLDRGIETVVFVVNFLNLMEPDDQQQVSRRMRFVAESFRSKLPAGISNLYRVDALPALRARLKGDMAAAQTAGLPAFESALQAIAQFHQEQPLQARLPRLLAIAPQVQQALHRQIESVTAEINAKVHSTSETLDQKVQIKQKAQKLIKQGFSSSLSAVQDWLALPNLLNQYQFGATTALQQFEFKDWESAVLKPDWVAKKKSVVEWVYKACDFFDRPRPADLWFAFPEEPEVILPDSPQSDANAPRQKGDVAPVAIATGLGWVLGGPIGAAVFGGASYLINQTNQTDANQPQPVRPSNSVEDYTTQLNQLYGNAAKDYLSRFSSLALTALQQYEIAANAVIEMAIAPESAPAPDLSHQRHQLSLLQSRLDNLNQALNLVRL
ncbi:dynamin family protein [Leptolyngbya sp. FACHB-541]|uniref:dynamin family protein n=1 Tax=Leptolyngbya sp. FACHB-541 TaxID=2692810 RepID=UPI001684FD1C|nr:dynamin family protein [Leptolyngbya sp. FACHB-541]MBD2001620.1 dynamin family protein [Leptolyngbya sp. FACHB-541]